MAATLPKNGVRQSMKALSRWTSDIITVIVGTPASDETLSSDAHSTKSSEVQTEIGADHDKKDDLGDDSENVHSFCVHKDLLVQHSDFFKAALKEEWKEGQERVVRLPKGSPGPFAIFVGFVYTGKICCAGDGDLETQCSEWDHLANAWVLGQVLMSVSFKDAALDALIAKGEAEGRSCSQLQDAVYPAGSKSSRIRRWLVDLTKDGFDAETVADMKFDPKSAEFFYDLAISMKSDQEKQSAVFLDALAAGIESDPDKTMRSLTNSPWKQQSCHYHEHGETLPCYKTMFPY